MRFERTVVALVLATAILAARANAQEPALLFEQQSRDGVGAPSGWKIDTTVRVYENGQVDVDSKMICTNNLLGFTGGVLVLLADGNGRYLGDTKVHTRGVNSPGPDLNPFDGDAPKSTAPLHFSETFSPDLISRVKHLRIVHSHEPNVELINDRLEDFRKGAKTIAEILTILKPLL